MYIVRVIVYSEDYSAGNCKKLVSVIVRLMAKGLLR